MKKLNLFFCIFTLTTTLMSASLPIDSDPLEATGLSNEEKLVVEELYSLALKNIEMNLPASENIRLKPKVLKLGEEFIFSLEKIQNESMNGFVQLRAESIKNLESVINKVTRTSLGIAEMESAPIVDTTQESSKIGRTRKNITSFAFAGIGPGQLVGLDNNSVATNFALGFSFVTSARTNLKILFDHTSATKDVGKYYQLGVESSYYLNDKANSPFILGGLAIGWASRSSEEKISYQYYDCQSDSSYYPYSYNSTYSKSETASGISPKIGFGYHFSRNSRIQSEVLLQYSLLATSGLGGKIPSVIGIQYRFFIGMH